MNKHTIAPAPCGNCPFRKDTAIYLRPERRAGIVGSLLNNQDFYCHGTTVEGEDSDGECTREVTSNSSVCAGAAKMLLGEGITTNFMRILERLGTVTLDEIAARGADVWTLDQWPRLAEGSTGDDPVWLEGDEHGADVECCSVVGPDCEAPAGYAVNGGVVRGTVAATERCETCGEAVCSSCIDENGRCETCAEWDDDEEMVG